MGKFGQIIKTAVTIAVCSELRMDSDRESDHRPSMNGS